MLALVCYERAPGCMELRELPIRSPGPGDVLVRVEFAGICGSDLKLFHGTHPHATPPVVAGHEFSGVVAAVGDKVSRVKVGDRVTGLTTFYPDGVVVGDSENGLLTAGFRIGGLHADGAFAEYVMLREQFTLQLPDGVTFKMGALTEPLVVAVHAVFSKARILPHHKVLVSGPGTIGLLVTQLCRLRGADVMVAGLSRDAGRLARALKAGATVTVDVEQQELSQAVAEWTGGKGVDVTFECAGAAASADSCLAALKKAGSHVQVGTFGHGSRPAIPMNHVIFKELSLAGVFGYSIDDWRVALRLLSTGKVDTDIIVSHLFQLTEWQQAFCSAEGTEGVKVLVRPID